ncbi:MAG TPA: hypothetical protein VJA21_31735 [Verrucomicrobiae bacterium]
MENPAQFDLNDRIRQWRIELANSPALGGRDLDELETHLRDSFEVLRARGVEAREAFEMALRRLGTSRELEAEFAKVNSSWVWSERALWVLCGVLGANLLGSFAAFFSNVVLNLSTWKGLGPRMIGCLQFITYWIATVALIWLVVQVVTRRSHWLQRAGEVALKKPVWAGLALIGGLEVLQVLPRHAMRWLEPLWQHLANTGRSLPAESHTVISAWLVWGFFLTQALWVASVPLMAAYVWRKRSQSGVWLQRGLWVLIGVVVARLFTGLILEPSSVLLAVSYSAPPLVQHLAGLASIGLCLGVAAGTLLALAKTVSKYPAQWEWVSRLCRERPLVGAILCVSACAAVETSLYFVARMVLPGQLGIGTIGSSWLRASGVLVYVVVPTTLLLWLARRRQARFPAVTS